MSDLVAALLLWMAINTPYTNVKDPPIVLQLSEAALQDYAREKGLTIEVAGIYVCSIRTLIVRDNLDVQEHVPKSLVLHELMHHAQCLDGKRDACANEREAYGAQAKWLRDQKAFIPADTFESWSKRDCALFR